MERIALVSVTLNAVNPMTDYFQKRNPKLTIVNYLDSYLLEKTTKEGGVNDDSMRRMFDMLSKACADGAQAVLLTCSVFSLYVDEFSALLSKPIVCPDKAMLEQAAAAPGKSVILCTNPGTVKSTGTLYGKCRKKLGLDEKVDMLVLEEAYDALGHGDFETHDRLLREKVMELDEVYDNIIFAQISMARAAEVISTKHAEVYTSPGSAYKAMEAAVKANS